MRILITGVAGFLGSHLADELLAEGHDILGVDNFITGSEDNIRHLDGVERFTLLRQDVTEPLAIDGPIDRIYHLASPSTPKGYSINQIATLKTNSQGTWNLLELALAKNARFLLTSTSEVYGDPAVQPQHEEYWGNVNPVGLRSMYDEAKRFAEACTMAYHRERGADTRIVRLFNTYGPRMEARAGRAVINFIRQVLCDEPITIYGSGRQTRSLCYVSDTIGGMILAMESDFHEPLNLGNPEEVSILQIAREVRELVWGCRSRIEHQPAAPDDPRQLCPDITRARQVLGWAPRVPRKEGLAKMIEYYRPIFQAREHADATGG